MEEQEIEAAEIIRAGGELGRLCLRKDGFLREAQPQTQSKHWFKLRHPST